MSSSALRSLIVVLTLATALIHLYLNIALGSFSPLFTLNGVGYLVLLVALLQNIPRGQIRLQHFAFMAYVLVTILAWVAIGDKSNPLGIITKVIELLLLAALWLHLRRQSA